LLKVETITGKMNAAKHCIQGKIFIPSVLTVLRHCPSEISALHSDIHATSLLICDQFAWSLSLEFGCWL